MKGQAVEVDYRGERITLAALSARCGVSARTLYARIFTYGKSVEEAAARSVRKRSGAGGRPAAGVPRAVPKLKRHPSGRAYSRWKMRGETHERYFGKWASQEAADGYRKFSGDWLAGKYDVTTAETGATGGASVAGLASRWLDHVQAYHIKNGKPTSEVAGCRAAVKLVAELYGDRPASEFDPAALRACRETLVARDLSRHTCNAYTGRIVRMFAWGAGQSLVPAAIHGALKLVEHLKAGRTSAPDRARKRPATDAQIAATLPHLCPADEPKRKRVAAMIALQRLAGMRSGEVCALAPGDLDTAGDVWRYTVGKVNKNAHRGKAQVYYLGPRAVAILRPFLAGADPARPVFGLTPGTYGHAVLRASIKAGCQWMPHQLRHALATEVAAKFRTLEHAAAAIGDTEAVAAAVYVHVDPRERAKIEVARAMG